MSIAHSAGLIINEIEWRTWHFRRCGDRICENVFTRTRSGWL